MGLRFCRRYMPKPNYIFSEEKVVEILHAYGIEPVERYLDGVIIWGTREIGKEFPVRFLAAKPFSPGEWDIFVIRNLLDELEVDPETADKIDNELYGYRPAFQPPSES